MRTFMSFPPLAMPEHLLVVRANIQQESRKSQQEIVAAPQHGRRRE
jgi:hypothetical protein